MNDPVDIIYANLRKEWERAREIDPDGTAATFYAGRMLRDPQAHIAALVRAEVLEVVDDEQLCYAVVIKPTSLGPLRVVGPDERPQDGFT